MAKSLRQLMAHQAEGLRRAMPLGSVGLFWEMRLGKTIPAIRWAESKRPDHALVVCPREVMPNWADELAAEGHEGVELSGPVAGRLELAKSMPDHRWFITNYEGLIERRNGASRPSGLARLPWDLVILDESTRVRRPKARVTKVAVDFLSQARHKALLSGLPNPEGPEDLVTQMMFLRGGMFMGCSSFWEWRAKHMQAVGFDWSVKWSSYQELRREMDKDCQWLTRKQAGVGNKKIYEVRWVDLPAKIVKAMRDADETMQIGDRLAMNRLQIITWCLQIAGGRYPHDESLRHDAKLDQLSELVSGELKRERVVHWCHYTSEIEAVAGRLKKCGRSVEIATGATRAANASNARRFQKGEFTDFVCQPRIFQYGKDLSLADTAIYFSNYYDREIRTQSEDRVESVFKKTPLLIIDLVAKDTYDVDVVDALKDKEADAKTFWHRILGKLARRKA